MDNKQPEKAGYDYEHMFRYYYSSLYDPGERLRRRRTKALLRNKVNDTTAALDVGGGPGILVDVLTELGGAAVSYFCLDISRNQLRIHSSYARSKGYPVRTVQGDAQILPIRTGACDLVFCFETLEHLESDTLAISEIGRVLRAGGTLVVSVPYAEGLSDRRRKAEGHLHSYDITSFQRLTHGRGFEIERTDFVSRFTHLFWTLPKLAIYFVWLLCTRNLVKRLRGFEIPSYYDIRFHKNFVMPLVDRLLIFDRLCSRGPYSIFGKAVSMVVLLKKHRSQT